MIIETFRQALQNVWSNKLRTFLTMLGIIIGVMAVIVIVGLGNGMTQSMRDSFSALGTNALSIQVWGYGSRTASVEDVYKIADKNKELISAVSPQIDFSNNTPKVGTTTYRYGTSVYGVDEHYAEMKNYTLAQGRGLQYMDIKDNKQVCIIGDYLNRAPTAQRGGPDHQAGGLQVPDRGRAERQGDGQEHAAAPTMTASICPTPRPCGSPTSPAPRTLLRS